MKWRGKKKWMKFLYVCKKMEEQATELLCGMRADMIRSMTGYGRFEAENEESRLTVEINQ